MLRRNKAMASLLLAVAAGIFLATFLFSDASFWVALLRATSEAAVVGALADWFAVTAVFRRPLGLPIPHTAIVPRNQERIGEGLGDFLASNFLTAPLLAAKVGAVAPADRLARWLAEPANAARAAERLTGLMPYLIRSLEDATIRDFAAAALGERLRSADLSPALGRLLSVLTSGTAFDALFERTLDWVQRVLLAEGETIGRLVEERTAWWVPRAVDRRIAREIVAGATGFIEELRDPASARRAAFRRQLARLGEDLATSDRYRARLSAIQAQLVEQPEIVAWLGGIWDAARGALMADLARPESRTREALAHSVLSLGRGLAADQAMRRRLDAALSDALVAVIVPWRSEIGRFVSDVVRGWDRGTVVRRLELALGGDLQYIRITGTLVGACVGALLFLIGRMLG